MKLILFIVFMLPTLVFGGDGISSCDTTQGIIEAKYEHGGYNREFILYRPADLPKNAPVVFVLHGLTGTAAGAIKWHGMNEVADREKFAVVYPQGLTLGQAMDGSDSFEVAEASYQTTFWKTYPIEGLNVDDLDFLVSLAGLLQEECNLNPERTFISGHSAGGAMSYTAACEAPHVFKAAASIAGTMSSIGTNVFESCRPSRPVPVLQVHGADDKVVAMAGSEDKESGKMSPSIEEVVLFWAKLNKYETVEEIFVPPRTTAYRYKNSVDKNEVWFYKIADWGHGWSRASQGTGIETGDVIWEFFSRH